MKIYPIDDSAKKINDNHRKSPVVYCVLPPTNKLSYEKDRNTNYQWMKLKSENTSIDCHISLTESTAIRSLHWPSSSSCSSFPHSFIDKLSDSLGLSNRLVCMKLWALLENAYALLERREKNWNLHCPDTLNRQRSNIVTNVGMRRVIEKLTYQRSKCCYASRGDTYSRDLSLRGKTYLCVAISEKGKIRWHWTTWTLTHNAILFVRTSFFAITCPVTDLLGYETDLGTDTCQNMIRERKVS